MAVELSTLAANASKRSTSRSKVCQAVMAVSTEISDHLSAPTLPLVAMVLVCMLTPYQRVMVSPSNSWMVTEWTGRWRVMAAGFDGGEGLFVLA